METERYCYFTNKTNLVGASWKSLNKMFPVRTTMNICLRKFNHSRLGKKCLFIDCEMFKDDISLQLLFSFSSLRNKKNQQIWFQLFGIDSGGEKREKRLRWFGHVECSSGAIRTECVKQIDCRRGAGRPKLTWRKLTERDCRELKLTTIDPQERSTWRSGVRSAMRAASQLPGKGPTDMDDAPAPAC